jgi:hypothetical protein
MYAEIERLRTECSRLEALVVVAKPVAAPQPEVKRDKTIFIAAAAKQRAEFAVARTAFIKEWCTANNATSVPGNVVADWAAARR